METPKINQSAIKKLRAKLPRGYAEKLSKSTGYSSRTVYNVLGGSQFNLQIIEGAVKLAREYQQDAEELQKELDTLLNE